MFFIHIRPGKTQPCIYALPQNVGFVGQGDRDFEYRVE